jgi:hypothetical protein
MPSILLEAHSHHHFDRVLRRGDAQSDDSVDSERSCENCVSMLDSRDLRSLWVASAYGAQRKKGWSSLIRVTPFSASECGKPNLFRVSVRQLRAYNHARGATGVFANGWLVTMAPNTKAAAVIELVEELKQAQEAVDRGLMVAGLIELCEKLDHLGTSGHRFKPLKNYCRDFAHFERYVVRRIWMLL